MKALSGTSGNPKRRRPAFIMVLEANTSAEGMWQASVPLARGDPEEVQHDGSIFLIPRHADDRVCRRVTALNPLTGVRDAAVIIELGPIQIDPGDGREATGTPPYPGC